MQTVLVVIIVIMALVGLGRTWYKATRPDASCGSCPKHCKGHCKQ